MKNPLIDESQTSYSRYIPELSRRTGLSKRNCRALAARAARCLRDAVHGLRPIQIPEFLYVRYFSGRHTVPSIEGEIWILHIEAYLPRWYSKANFMYQHPNDDPGEKVSKKQE